jgi:hypothetical protein
MFYNPHLKSEMWGTHFVPAQAWTTRHRNWQGRTVWCKKMMTSNTNHTVRPRWQTRSEKEPGLPVISALGYIFDCIGKWPGVFGAVNSPLQYIVPCDVGIEVMGFGLVFKESF